MKQLGRSKAGKKGGKVTKERYGKDYFKKIGQMGGKARGRRKRSRKS